MLYIGVDSREQQDKIAEVLKEDGKLSPMTLFMMIYKYQAPIDYN